ncbi:MAG: synthase, Delta/Epsilon chain, beta-sandwich domain [Verrucomicrobiota bacterium]|jgi:F-type H+-transporting ATPase subunit epsilon|nr:synthase, Delta/Epsilon chain, beta-sandwich domain [Verrucomicrobiota bacterium]MDK2963142.1 synthase, Delta/Epsilon chain, beta-sandwich domain [Verrucomicrobiota bacterium]
MAAQLKVKIITPKEVAWDEMALAVTFTAELGEMQVYPGHMPILSKIVPGFVRIEKPTASPVSFKVDEGFVRVTQNEVCLLVDSVLPA